MLLWTSRNELSLQYNHTWVRNRKKYWKLTELGMHPNYWLSNAFMPILIPLLEDHVIVPPGSTHICNFSPTDPVQCLYNIVSCKTIKSALSNRRPCLNVRIIIGMDTNKSAKVDNFSSSSNRCRICPHYRTIRHILFTIISFLLVWKDRQEVSGTYLTIQGLEADSRDEDFVGHSTERKD